MKVNGDFETHKQYVLASLNRAEAANIPKRAIISSVYLPITDTPKKTYAVHEEVDALTIDLQGIVGDRHYGFVRKNKGRDETYKRKINMWNDRDLFCVSSPDNDKLSKRVGAQMTPELLGANILIDREDDEPFYLSNILGGTRLCIDGPKLTDYPIATLQMTAKQQGCATQGACIQNELGVDGLAKKFIEESKDNRGIVCEILQVRDDVQKLESGMYVHFQYPKYLTR